MSRTTDPADLDLAAALHARVDARIPRLATTMVDRFVAQIPVYSTLPTEQLHGEVHGIAVANLRLLLRCLRDGRVPTMDELAEPRASAARRAEERVPLDAVLSAYLIGAEILWEAMVAEAADHERAVLPEVAGLLLAFIREMIPSVSQAYMDEQQSIAGEERDARREATEALLTRGAASPALLERAGVRPGGTNRAVALRFDPTPDESDASVSGLIAARRKVRRAAQAVEAAVGHPCLTLLDASGGAAVLPSMSTEDLDDLRSVLADAVGAAVWLVASDPVPGEGLPAAWRQVSEVRHLLVQLGRPAALYTPDDVLLERTVAADKSAAARLAGILQPLSEREDLLATLQAWFDADFDRRTAAQALMVHPNTLDYRLRRITELTGKDVGSAAGSQLLGAALLARRLMG